ncbi:MAG: hypothetical protein ACI3V5_12005 [Faecousia sp.]
MSNLIPERETMEVEFKTMNEQICAIAQFRYTHWSGSAPRLPCEKGAVSEAD